MNTAAFNPSCDVEEDANRYLLSFDLPGVSKEDVKIEFNDNQLVVSGERKFERKDDPKSTRHFTERYYGSFRRAFALPSKVDAERIEAAYQDGVLMIAIPKSEAAKPRTIKIGDTKEGGLLSSVKRMVS